MDLLNNPLMVPILGIVFGSAMIVGIVAIAHWHKVREKELQYHQNMRIREMEHQRKMKELEIELEKAKARDSSGHAA